MELRYANRGKSLLDHVDFLYFCLVIIKVNFINTEQRSIFVSFLLVFSQRIQR